MAKVDTLLVNAENQNGRIISCNIEMPSSDVYFD